MRLKCSSCRLSLFQFFIGLFLIVASINSNASYLSLTNQTPYKINFNAEWGTIFCSNDSGIIEPGKTFYNGAGWCALDDISVTVDMPDGTTISCSSNHVTYYQYIQMTSPTTCYVGP